MPTAAQLWAELTWGGVAVQYVAMIAIKVSALYLIGFGFWFVERLRPADPKARFLKDDFATEACYPLFNILVSTPVLTLLLIVATTHLLEPYAPHHVLAGWVTALPFVLQVLVALLIADLAVYVEHRFLAHRALWPYHALHHVTPEVSWLTTVRVHPVNAITIAFVAAVMQYVIGFTGAAVVTAAWISSALSFWEHANLDVVLPRPFCWLIVTPRFHRWHHASEPEAVDKNFSLIFPFIDLLCGTYYCPDRLPQGYGLAEAHDVPDSFLGQLRHPFVTTLARARSALGMRSVGAAS